MPIFRYFAVTGPALLVLLFVSDAFLRDDESDSRFDRSFYQSAIYAPRVADTLEEPCFTRDVSPADRVKEVFAQFVPNEGKRNKRYSSIATRGT